jgi:hypothetical protein
VNKTVPHRTLRGLHLVAPSLRRASACLVVGQRQMRMGGLEPPCCIACPRQNSHGGRRPCLAREVTEEEVAGPSHCMRGRVGEAVGWWVSVLCQDPLANLADSQPTLQGSAGREIPSDEMNKGKVNLLVSCRPESLTMHRRMRQHVNTETPSRATMAVSRNVPPKRLLKSKPQQRMWLWHCSSWTKFLSKMQNP